MSKKVVKCSRCGRRQRRLEGWNVVFNGGMVEGYLCPGCQTPEEDLEAQVNEVLTDYSKVRTTSDPDEIAGAVVKDMIARVEREWRAICRRSVETGETIIGGDAEDSIVERVTAGLPDHYRQRYSGEGGDISALVREMTRAVMTGEMHEDEPDEQ